jgi:predicted Zn finger-like uncharacterized protein
MLIQCPRCSTGWRVADVPATENPIFKCGRCHHVFRQFPGAPAPAARRSAADKRTAARRPTDDNLEFIFPDPTPETDVRDEPALIDDGDDGRDGDDDLVMADEHDGDDDLVMAGEDEDDDVVMAGQQEEDDDLGMTTEDDDDADLAIDDAGDRALDDAPDDAGGREFVAADTADDPVLHHHLDEPEDDDVRHELDRSDDADETPRTPRWSSDLDSPASMPTSRVLHVEDIMPSSYGFRAIVRPLAAIVALHAALALTIRLAPEQAGAWLSHVPFAGVLLAREPTLARRVELRNVIGQFQQLRNDRRVFVISGEAVNHAHAAVDRIEVEGTLYGPTGRVDQKVVNAGNRTTLTDLSESEIALLQRLDPRAIIGPGESSAFSIVFLEPPREIREFSSRVLNVRRTRRLATDPAGPGPRRGSVG